MLGLSVISTIPCLVEYTYMLGGDGYFHHSMLGVTAMVEYEPCARDDGC